MVVNIAGRKTKILSSCLLLMEDYMVEITLRSGENTFKGVLEVNSGVVTFLKSNNPESTLGWKDLTLSALDNPIDGGPSLSRENLKGKKVVVIVDDWGRPTPVYLIVPTVIEELRKAGSKDEDISFITASGMHNPMNKEDLERKLGKEIVENFKCYSHDGGDIAQLKFIGISDLGTPIWINKVVAEAEYKIAIGRVFPHPTYGYEGGYKMIVPGVASFETILRDHGLNFSPYSDYGIVENPSRGEAEAIGKMVGLDYTINYVMNFQDEPIIAYGGRDAIRVQRKCVEYGDNYVWGARYNHPADLVIASMGENEKGWNRVAFALGMARRVCKDGGIIMFLLPTDEPEDKNEFRRLSLSELLRLHEKRTWQDLSERDVQWRLKAIRSEFYRRRAFCDKRHIIKFVGGKVSSLTLEETKGEYYTSFQEALDSCKTLWGKEINVAILPEASKVVPLPSNQ
jgi:nickel-dependent lactate racemase